MNLVGIKSRKASSKKIATNIKNKVLNKYAQLLDEEKKLILRENAKDIKFAQNKGLKDNLINRLTIDDLRLKNIKNSILASDFRLRPHNQNITGATSITAEINTLGPLS